MAILSLIAVISIAAMKATSTTAEPRRDHKEAKRLHSSKVEKEVCLDAENGIVYYRGVTWTLESKLRDSKGTHKARSRTTFPERLSSHCPYKRYEAKVWLGYAGDRRSEWERYQKEQRLLNDVEYAICKVFGSYCQQALDVSWCESRHHITSWNGQYHGLFQMGSSERLFYGDSDTAYGQALAAYRYFVDSGKNWSPWTCKPWH